jgi:hypothetical protein
MGKGKKARKLYRREATVSLPLKTNWKAKPGCKIFVADRGAVRFEFPREWWVKGDPDSIKFRDRKPPHDDCVLAVSYLRLPPADWKTLPLSALVAHATEKSTERRGIRGWGEIVADQRIDLEIAWRQGFYTDSKEDREAVTRLCLARRNYVQALLTMDCWASELERFTPVWDHVLDSLELDESFTNPWVGPPVH